MPFSQLGLCTKLFGRHIFRSGSATAVPGAGVNNDYSSVMGRCPCDKIKDGYVKDNLIALLSVSYNLQL